MTRPREYRTLYDVAKITVVYNDLVVKVQSYQNVLEYKEKELSDLQDNE